jgi:integrase
METLAAVETEKTSKRKARKRERGEGGLVKKPGSKNWYLLYYDLNGKQHSESSGTRSKEEAQKMLTNRLEAVRTGNQPLGEVRRLRYEDIRDGLIGDYKAAGKITEENGVMAVSGHRHFFKQLDDFFTNMPVIAITTDVLREFVSKRMKEGISGPTVNRNLALLRRMFKLAQREGKLQNVPYFPMQKESAPREGFVERPDCEKLRAAMPERLHPALTFAYETGCRIGAMKQIIWAWMQLDKSEVHLPAGVIKNRKPLALPLSPELVGMLKKLFHTDGPVFDTTNFRKEWNKACVKLGLGKQTGKKWFQYEGLIPHDFRRSAVRNLVNAGVDQSTAMKITGHKTVSVFQRYNIISTEQLHEAAKKVADYNASLMQVAANSGTSSSVTR